MMAAPVPRGGNTFASPRRWGIALPSVLFHPPIPARGAPRSNEGFAICDMGLGRIRELLAPSEAELHSS
jgi:hypothetical protein